MSASRLASRRARPPNQVTILRRPFTFQVRMRRRIHARIRRESDCAFDIVTLPSQCRNNQCEFLENINCAQARKDMLPFCELVHHVLWVIPGQHGKATSLPHVHQ